MLEEIAGRRHEATLFRYAADSTDDDFLSSQEMNLEQVSEMKKFLNVHMKSDHLEKLIDAPFEPKRRLFDPDYPVSRFSDGSFPIGYFSLEPETAEAERRYWFCKKFAGNPKDERVAWYTRFTCDFQGLTKDLRPMQTKWPDLVHRNDYSLCNSLGVEAVSEDLDGMLAPSVRKLNGTNVPVFARRALSNPRNPVSVKIRCDVSHKMEVS